MASKLEQRSSGGPKLCAGNRGKQQEGGKMSLLFSREGKVLTKGNSSDDGTPISHKRVHTPIPNPV